MAFAPLTAGAMGSSLVGFAWMFENVLLAALGVLLVRGECWQGEHEGDLAEAAPPPEAARLRPGAPRLEPAVAPVILAQPHGGTVGAPRPAAVRFEDEDAYEGSLKKYHGFVIGKVFKTAMSMCVVPSVPDLHHRWPNRVLWRLTLLGRLRTG